MSIKIYIDQGHNPRDFNTGAIGNGYYEQDITYDIGKRLYALLLQNREFIPRLSRPRADTVLGFSNSSSLVARVNEANEWGADVFISLHTNASDNNAASGAEVLIYSLDLPVPRELGGDILTELTRTTGLRDRGLKERPGLYVLRRTQMPAVLVEMGFITNAGDAELMVNSPELFARGIYKGIIKYYGIS